jgi:shikimate kinase
MFVKRNVFLVGPPAAGKSTVGKQLASRLGLEFVDTDDEIESRTGADVAWIFDVEGEEGFRARETALLGELTQRKGIVLSTGGGTIIKPENREMLSARGTVVYLRAGKHQIIERTLKDKKRPLLQVENRAEQIEKIIEERDPIYAAVSDLVIDTQDSAAKTVVNKIIEVLSKGADV